MNDAPFIPAWLDDRVMSRSAFRVLSHLWRRRNPRTGQCNPAIASIARVCRMHRDTVTDAIKYLADAGLLSRAKHGFRASNSYVLHVPPTSGRIPPIGNTNWRKKPAQLEEKTGTNRRKISGTKVPLLKVPHEGTCEPTASPSVAENNSSKNKKPRSRDPVFDLLASLDGSDPTKLTPSAASGVGKALKDIKVVTPHVTVSETNRRVANYHLHLPPGASISAHALAKHWSRCDNPPERRSPEPVRLGTNIEEPVYYENKQ